MAAKNKFSFRKKQSRDKNLKNHFLKEVFQ